MSLLPGLTFTLVFNIATFSYIAASLTLFVAIVRPYKKNVYNSSDTGMFVLFCGIVAGTCMFNWTLPYSTGSSLTFEALFFTLLSVPLLIAVGYVLFHLCVFLLISECIRQHNYSGLWCVRQPDEK